MTHIGKLTIDWYDEQYIFDSLVVLLTLMFIIGDLAFRFWTEKPKVNKKNRLKVHGK